MALLAINHWLLGDVVTRLALYAVKKPFGYLQRSIVAMVSPERNMEYEKYLDQTVKIEKLERENDQLRKQLGLKNRSVATLTSARIVAIESNILASTITIDQGSEDGISIGLPVVQGGNILLGVIRDVQKHSATVNLVDDSRERFSVRLLNTTTIAELKGTLRRNFQLDLISHSEAVTSESIVVTSGMDGFYEGLIMGKIVSVDRNENGLFQKVSGTVSFNLGDSSTVFVLK